VLLALPLLAGTAHATGPDASAELAAIDKLGVHSTKEALSRLTALQETLGADAPYPVQRDMLRAEVRLRDDAGQLQTAREVERRLMVLAQANNDPAVAARASLGEVRRLLDGNRPDEAQVELDRILAEVPASAPLVVRVAMERAKGDVFNARGKFDKALGAFLTGLRLLQNDPNGGEMRGVLRGRIAQVFVNTDRPDKAVESARLGLQEKGLSAVTTGTLQFQEGSALIRNGHGPEGIAAYRQALATAERGGLAALEANVRGNVADYYLRQHDYAQAEQESRRALKVSASVKDKNLIMMARANLGFGLMGQGRIAEAMPWIDGVIADLRAGGSLHDVEAMLDEKGRMLEAAKMYREALATVREQQALQLSNARIARDKAIAALQEEFDASQRNRQIELLRSENRLKDAELGSRRTAQLATTFAAVLTVLAGAVVYVLYRRASRSAARLQQLNTQLEYHSTRDALTGLHNRRSFLDKMRARKESTKDDRRQRAAQGVDCFVLMDIDHFKAVNDRWGHGVGDTVLVEVARRLVSSVRDSDMVLRWGGEEFMVYAPATDPAHVPVLVQRVLDAVGSSPVVTPSGPVTVTVTAGAIALPLADEQADWQESVRLADWALYEGKARGRNQAHIVRRLHAPVAAAIAALETADAATLLDLEQVHGPRQETQAA
jgi:diguanylate cyclase (GGDEF)-like protein